MHYFGGKHRIAKQLAAYMQPHVDANEIYIEPFVGGANVLSQIKAPVRVAADANEALINMYRALDAGWIPPKNISEDKYNILKSTRDPSDPLTAFVGFGCSFAGKWFGGYARDNISRNYCTNAANSLMRKWQRCKGTIWQSGDYASLEYPPGAVVYCDPPYAGTNGYEAVGKFNIVRFWEFVRELSHKENIVFVSEYNAPPDFQCVLEIKTKLDIRNAEGTKDHRLEKLFTLSTGANEMARKVGSKNKSKVAIDGEASPIAEASPKPRANSKHSPQAENLSRALEFVSVAGTKKDTLYKSHVILNNGFAIASDGIITAGHPIEEGLECCPQLALLRSALANSGNELSLTESDNGGWLTVKGERLRAPIPCLPFQDMPDASFLAPDANVMAFDATSDAALRKALEVTSAIATEAATTFLESAIFLEPNVCTSSDRKIAVQYWHGIAGLPPISLPKLFAQSLLKIKKQIVGIGCTYPTSFAAHFDDGSWLKTRLYEDQYPIATLNGILSEERSCAAFNIPEGFFEAAKIVSEFSDGEVIARDGSVSSHEDETLGASYALGEKHHNTIMKFKIRDLTIIAPYAKTIDFRSSEQKAWFFGDKFRAVISAITLAKTTKLSPERASEEFQKMPVPDTDEIPF